MARAKDFEAWQALTLRMKTQHPDERTLVSDMLSGKEQAFEEFFNMYFPGLFRFALTRLRQESAAEEVVQRALCKAITKLGAYRGEAALFTWLCTFCRHEISAYLKAENHLYLTDLLQETPEIAAALESLLTAAEERPDQVLLRKEVSQLVQIALDALPFHYSSALEWKYIEGASVKDIAERLNLGAKAAESLLTRARQAFRDSFRTLTSDYRFAT
jgi:RNA polymerase sigma-70 factor (ECF subfamily)